MKKNRRNFRFFIVCCAQGEMSSFVTYDIGIAKSNKIDVGFLRFAVQIYKAKCRMDVNLLLVYSFQHNLWKAWHIMAGTESGVMPWSR